MPAVSWGPINSAPALTTAVPHSLGVVSVRSMSGVVIVLFTGPRSPLAEGQRLIPLL